MEKPYTCLQCDYLSIYLYFNIPSQQ
jgi:hypothetical protein